MAQEIEGLEGRGRRKEGSIPARPLPLGFLDERHGTVEIEVQPGLQINLRKLGESGGKET